MKVALFITLLLLCSYSIQLPAVFAQFPVAPQASLAKLDSSSSVSVVADCLAEPQSPGSGGGGGGTI